MDESDPRTGCPGDRSHRKAISARVIGRVQGVGFRVATARRARELGLSGWVRNLPDRSVEAWAQGEVADVDAFVAFLRVGPFAAQVDAVTVLPAPQNPDMVTFDVRG